MAARTNHENGITPAHETIMIFPLPGTSRTGTRRTGSGFGVEPTWFSGAMLARALDDSANQKSGLPSAGVDVERLGLTFRVADFFIAGPPVGRATRPPAGPTL